MIILVNSVPFEIFSGNTVASGTDFFLFGIFCNFTLTTT